MLPTLQRARYASSSELLQRPKAKAKANEQFARPAEDLYSLNAKEVSREAIIFAKILS
jgi:hypothetical protein